MKHSLFALVFLLLSFPTVRSQEKSAGGDFADRPPPPVTAEAKSEMQKNLAEARAKSDSNPNDPEGIIWLGRRLAYLGQFRDAIDTFTKGVEKFPNDPRFYRHRGHRHITIRRFDRAISDFEQAAKLIKDKPDEVEPDGQPNARNIPTSTLQFNIWYHLGLAYYLTGDYEKALKSYRECLKVSKNPDALAATSHWLYMTLRRLNRNAEAAQVLNPIHDKMDIIENDGYYRLLLMYKGVISREALQDEILKQAASPGSHSVLYGLGSWYVYNGRRADAVKILGKITESEQWTSFGYIAAEADLKRLSAARSSAGSK